MNAWSIFFLIVAAVAAIFGFAILHAGIFCEIAKGLFAMFMTLYFLSLLNKKPKPR